MILIRRADGVEERVEESLLVRIELQFEDDNERTTVVEYCLASCDNPVHDRANREQREARWDALDKKTAIVWCERHVHRSSHVQLKRWPAGLDGVAQALV